ncbi:MAG: hypothetical protein LBB80_00365 [Treponema sp.]|jgi:hypothetical protein|nr:hypothetical protein [Treponema sp.]
MFHSDQLQAFCGTDELPRHAFSTVHLEIPMREADGYQVYRLNTWFGGDIAILA